MEGLFGQGVFFEGGGDCGNEVDPLRVYPIDMWNLETLWKREGWKKSLYC